MATIHNDIQAELAQLRAENEALKAKAAAKGYFKLKVSEKGAVSAYGLGRFPVTLYRSQWEALLAQKDKVTAFIEENASSLKAKE